MEYELKLFQPFTQYAFRRLKLGQLVDSFVKFDQRTVRSVQRRSRRRLSGCRRRAMHTTRFCLVRQLNETVYELHVRCIYMYVYRFVTLIMRQRPISVSRRQPTVIINLYAGRVCTQATVNRMRTIGTTVIGMPDDNNNNNITIIRGRDV